MKTIKLLLIALVLLVGSFTQAAKTDTIRVVLLVSDTTHYVYDRQEWQSCEDVGCKGNHSENVAHFKTVKIDEGNGGTGRCYWVYGYSVRKFHYGNEFVNSSSCINCPDYWEHIYYLDSNKKRTKLIVWQSIPVKISNPFYLVGNVGIGTIPPAKDIEVNRIMDFFCRVQELYL